MKNTYNTSTTVSQYDYTYDAIGRRSDVDWSGTAFTASDTITYAYNDRSELLNADASTNANYLFGYTYDNIGNFSTSATSETGTAVTSAYTTNNVNQYTAVDTSTNNPTYDDDGNMTTMPVLPGGATAWTLEWNAENRLVKATLGTTVMDFVYDYAGRRVEKKITEDGTVTSREFFVYDGWNLIETLDALNSSAITHKFVWGQDLSGTLQGAGGVGGLLSATDSSGTYYSLYDANGNVGQYLDGSGNIVAAYQYSPFGVIISKSGTKQDDFNFRFSTKFLDNSTGLYYYGFRYYSPRFARWINRDPIGEEGGINLYAMVGNNAVNKWDYLGLLKVTVYIYLMDWIDSWGGVSVKTGPYFWHSSKPAVEFDLKKNADEADKEGGWFFEPDLLVIVVKVEAENEEEKEESKPFVYSIEDMGGKSRKAGAYGLINHPAQKNDKGIIGAYIWKNRELSALDAFNPYNLSGRTGNDVYIRSFYIYGGKIGNKKPLKKGDYIEIYVEDHCYEEKQIFKQKLTIK